MMIRHVPGLLLAVALVAGCSSGADEPETESTSTSTATASASASVPDACQQVAEEIPASAYPDPSEWDTYVSTLDEIAPTAPEEVDSALTDLREAAQMLSEDPTSTDLLDARKGLRESLNDLNTVCKAHGSNALA